MAKSRVIYWEKWGGQEIEVMEGVVRAFNRAQDRYEVTMLQTGDWASSPDLPKFLSAQAGGSPPDVIGLEDHQLTDLAASGAIVPLPAPVVDEGIFASCFSSLGLVEGTLYGAPISVDLVTYYVNLSAVRGSVFDGGVLPHRISDFVCAMDEYERGGGFTLVPSYPGWWPHAWELFYGGSRLEAMQWVRSVRDKLASRCAGGSPTGVCGLLGSAVNPIGRLKPDPFLCGHVAIVLEGDYLVRRLIATPGVDFMPVAVPCADGVPSAMRIADLLSVPAGARNPEGAIEFIRFAASGEQVERIALGHCKVSPLKQWSDEFLGAHRNPRIRELKKIMDTARLFHDPRAPGWLRSLEEAKTAFTSIWLGVDGSTNPG